MEIGIEDHGDKSLIASVTADDGFELSFYVDLEKYSVSEFYIEDTDFDADVMFASSIYVIIDGDPKSISTIISEITTKIDDMKEWIAEQEAEAEDYMATTSFYFNRGKI